MTKTLFHRMFGVGRVPPKWRERLAAEEILRQEEGILVTMTLHHVQLPWRVVTRHKRTRSSGALVVTSQRLVGFSRSRSIIHVPWTLPNIHLLKFEVESADLLIQYDAQHFIEAATGSVDVRFRVADPAAFLQAIQTATGGE